MHAQLPRFIVIFLLTLLHTVRLQCLHCVIVEMMSESESLMLMNQGDEIWTEEEVIEFGLAGEEEYCDLETVETSIELPTMPDVTETAELVYLDDAESVLAEPDSRSSKKSGRVSTSYCFIDNANIGTSLLVCCVCPCTKLTMLAVVF